jgi:hypothetical protein
MTKQLDVDKTREIRRAGAKFKRWETISDAFKNPLLPLTVNK